MVKTLSKRLADLSEWSAEQVASRVGKKIVEQVGKLVGVITAMRWYTNHV